MKLTIQGFEPVRRELAAIGREMPFAASVALNAIANRTQAEIRRTLPGNFMLRRKRFVERTVYREPGVDFATKTRLQAGVGIHPERDVLTKHEDGGSKRSRDGGRLAVPVAVPRTAAGLIKAQYRPKALRGNSKVFRVDRPGADPIIAEQLGRGRNQRVRVLYTLKRSVWLRPRLNFYATAERVIDREWERAVRDGIDRALRTAR
ncbi:MAG: hypothetical protein MUF00_08675 [Gemmatimonadaceae bacterium]|nr:hypothetical protein [Gemmatimonadaceae bacterium]